MYCHILRVRAIPTLESTDSMMSIAAHMTGIFPSLLANTIICVATPCAPCCPYLATTRDYLVSFHKTM